MSAEEKASFRLPVDAMGAINFRAIERIYGDQVRSGPAAATGWPCLRVLQALVSAGATAALRACGPLLPPAMPCHPHKQRLLHSWPQGPTVVDLLKKNPTAAVPVILVRLTQKNQGGWPVSSSRLRWPPCAVTAHLGLHVRLVGPPR